MRALVTGACGFAGGYLVRHLVESGDQVTGTFFSKPQPGHAAEGLQIERIQLDITNQGECIKLIERLKPEVVYHLAGIAFVPEAEENFDRAILVNVGATNNIIRGLHLLQQKATVVQISSAEVYGRVRPADLPLTETSPTNPTNNYSASKLMSEIIGGRYVQGGYVRSVIMRPFNHIGPGQNDRFVASSFAKQLAAISKGKAAPVIKVGNLDAKRDFSDVRDIVRAYRLGALRGDGIYNLGAGKSVRVHDVLDLLIEVSGAKVTIENDPARMRPAEVPEVYGSYAKAKRDFGWEPTIPLRDSLRDLYRYWMGVV